MKLYITPASPYARMARIMVIEKGLESRVEIITAQTRLTDSPYYKINPSGRVPYLIRGDGVGLEESAVICAYPDHLDGKPLFDLPARRARVGGAPSRRVGEKTDSLFGGARSRGRRTNSRRQ
jgi:glutathione S-transferase